MSPAENFISRLSWSKRTGPGRWSAKCPAHKDRTASLLVTEKPDGKVTIHCFALCERESIIGALGLKWADLFPPKPANYVYQQPDRTDFHSTDILAALGDEFIYAYLVMHDFHRYLTDETQGQPPGPDTRARFLKATERVLAGAEMATGRGIKADEERREIIAAGILTEAEEIQLREFANA